MEQEQQKAEWADLFPEMVAFATKDPRIFHTEWSKVQPKNTQSPKVMKYFACIVGGSCYGVDVIRQWATDASKEQEEAYFKVKAAADFYDSQGHWPSEKPKVTPRIPKHRRI